MMFLRKLIEEQVDMALQESLRGTFNLNLFKTLKSLDEIHKYVKDSKLQFLGEGLGRQVYLLSSSKVLKLAGNEIGVMQNRDEVEGFKKFGSTGAVANIYDSNSEYMWVIMEIAKAFQSEGQLKAETGGLDDDFLIAFAYELKLKRFPTGSFRLVMQNLRSTWQKMSQTHPVFVHRLKKLAGINSKGIELLQKLYVLLTKHNVVDIARFDHWGVTADGRVVCVDYGIIIQGNS
jgi:hypothetical protein